MTLFRQIALLVSVVYLLLLAAVTWSDFRESSRFIQGQMHSNASDIATTLGVTIANAIAKDDFVAVDTLFNAVFDSGYYTRIALVSISGEMLRVKEREVASPGVPEWFIALVSLNAATGESRVMKGWQPYATVSVTLHPGYAYARLYQDLQAAFVWFVGVAAGGLAALWLLLHWLLQPLQKVCEQAEAIHENRFIQQPLPLPRTRELRQVATAMNRMVAKVQDVFNDQAATLKRNHELLYRDALTGLDNRRSFLLSLQARLDDEATRGGVVILVRLPALADANQRCGYEETNRMIAELAQLLAQRCPDAATDRCARMNASEFAICLQASPDAARDYVEAVFEAFRAQTNVAEAGPALWPSAGCVPIEYGRASGDVLAMADTALAQAQASGPWCIHLADPTEDDMPRSKGQWRAWLSEALYEHRFLLAAQPVFAPAQILSHHELFVRLRDSSGGLVPAGRFLPIAASLGFGFAVDREVFRLALAACESGATGPMALNLSSSVFADADALAEFDGIVRRFAKSAPGRLSVEVGHAGLMEHIESARHVADQLRTHGFSFGVDHFDPGADLHPLQSIRPAYIKVDARRLLDMASASPGSMQALRTLAGSLDIQILAAGVDSAELHERLTSLGVDGAQGNYYQATEIWP